MPKPPLSTVLSQALVAFMIECDNEAEHRIPHKTTIAGGPPQSPWLVSSTMYWSCLRWLDDDGLTIEQIERRARTATNVDGMRRWGYVRIQPNVAGDKKVRRGTRLMPTLAGRMARDRWLPLYGEIESRWAKRFGQDLVAELSQALGAIVNQLGPGLPYCLPILRYALTLPEPYKMKAADTDDTDASRLLGVRMARVLLGIAREFEQTSRCSLCMHANLLRVLDVDLQPVSDLPRLSGISKEAIRMGLGVLIKSGLAREERAPNLKGVQIKLTGAGSDLKQNGLEQMRRLEREWLHRYSELDRAWMLLQQIAGTGRLGSSELFAGLTPYPDGWRALVRQPEVLPHFPAVLHRGGFPDGS